MDYWRTGNQLFGGFWAFMGLESLPKGICLLTNNQDWGNSSRGIKGSVYLAGIYCNI